MTVFRTLIQFHPPHILKVCLHKFHLIHHYLSILHAMASQVDASRQVSKHLFWIPYLYLAPPYPPHIEGKGKGKVHPRTGHEGPEGEKRHSSTLPLTSALDEVGNQRHIPAALPPGKTHYALCRRVGGPQGRSWHPHPPILFVLILSLVVFGEVLVCSKFISHTHTHTHTHTHRHRNTYIHMYVYVCIYIYIYTHTHTHIYIYIYIMFACIAICL